ncbi:hypothetical protein A2331_02150 [Candidatus Falkowbacteria bacterium RIFOXYB2_FULL_34_18]|nr:MAG: hypothetical protein A2331_02150 [Candidatus Falkowbacteria bacterium RIFOXYB2_FULL_34_18]OGF36861.1 MAG: hypothetical protein A2466_06590 [Candidatus Falkowbacteria bacterium RIFOXYC2_FULL_34_220]OGF39060.1 MAG: hypothetical protein A2515_04595 [Candidatus Falkowbacteria bacterium RIFOXYD12_FULL_34_57]
MTDGLFKALSFSIMLSTNTGCNARCKSCISRITPSVKSIDIKLCSIPRVELGLRTAKHHRATHAILTGKADPTQEDDGYLLELTKLSRKYLLYVDMHTNGFLLQKGKKKEGLLKDLTKAGLTHITFSIASFSAQENLNFMGIKQNPKELIQKAHELELYTRCSLLLTSSTVYNAQGIMDYIYKAGANGADAVVIRELWIPDSYNQKSTEIFEWNKKNFVDMNPLIAEFEAISENKDNEYGIRRLRDLPWGVPVFSMRNIFSDAEHGVNVTFARCDDSVNDVIIKSIVHKPNGHGYRNWDDNGDSLY